MFSKIFPILQQYISSEDALIVGVSGGPDSTALLAVLANFFRRELRYASDKFPFIMAHVNHGIRGKEADKDEAFVRALAKKYGFRCEVKCVKLAGKSGQEERGRKIRRDFFEKLREKYKARWIVTAHTEDDQIETIVLNFLRGSGPAGLAGMKIANGFYLKPLLQTPKKEILAHLRSRKLKFCIDATNQDIKFRRNFLRKKLLPLFLKINPSFRQTLLRNAGIFRDIEEWLEHEAAQFIPGEAKTVSRFIYTSSPRPSAFNAVSETVGINAKEFLKLPPAVQSTALQLMYQKFSKQPYRLSSVKIGEIRRLIARNIGRKKIPLPQGGWIVLEKAKIRFVQA